MDRFAPPKQGSTLGINDRFLRLWHEVIPNESKWFPCLKGGEYRKWYGNHYYVVNWEHDGLEVKATGRATIRNSEKLFCEGISWSRITSHPSFREMPKGYFFESASGVCFPQKSDIQYTLGLLNSCVINTFAEIVNPTLTLQSGDVATIPVVKSEQNIVNEKVSTLVSTAKDDWDSFETSWDFKRHPLVELRLSGAYAWGDNPPAMSLESAYKAWELLCDGRFNKLKANEEELNRIFIDIYGLQDELTPEVEDKDVTVRKADLGRDIRSLISYAVGCMFGRYSLDCEGLAYAGGEWDASKYTTFPADKDNIIPICDDDYFDDDITGRFIKWVETVYGAASLESNLKFIADALGGKGTPRDVIRSYFLNDFYADHLKIYQKRPIYWLFDSGKKNGFKALIYMHRYQPDTIARMRTDYVHEQQSRYRTAIADLEQRVGAASAGERVRLTKQLQKLQAQAEEARVYEEKIHHLADRMIKIDLDDGVKVNYAKFEDVLAKIK